MNANKHHPFMRLGLRRMAIKARRGSDEQKQILRVIKDPDLLDALVEETDRVYQLEVRGEGHDSASRSFLNFLSWIIEHREQIIAIIKILILFADGKEPETGVTDV